MNGNNSPASLVLRENADPGGALFMLPGVLLTTMWVTFISFLSNYFLDALWGCQSSESRVLHPARPGPGPAFEVLSGLEIIQQFFFLPVRSSSEEKGGEDFWMGVLGAAGEP